MNWNARTGGVEDKRDAERGALKPEGRKRWLQQSSASKLAELLPLIEHLSRHEHIKGVLGWEQVVGPRHHWGIECMADIRLPFMYLNYTRRFSWNFTDANNKYSRLDQWRWVLHHLANVCAMGEAHETCMWDPRKPLPEGVQDLTALRKKLKGAVHQLYLIQNRVHGLMGELGHMARFQLDAKLLWADLDRRMGVMDRDKLEEQLGRAQET
jgi:hypothetical protein